MKKLILPALLFLFACSEEITPLPDQGSNVLTITSNQYVEVKIEGFGSVWVNGTERVVVPRGTLNFHACGIDGEFIHDGVSKMNIECQ